MPLDPDDEPMGAAPGRAAGGRGVLDFPGCCRSAGPPLNLYQGGKIYVQRKPPHLRTKIFTKRGCLTAALNFFTFNRGEKNDLKKFKE